MLLTLQVRLRANHELMSRQTHALRDALAMARVLNRTLILPHFDCLCDRSEDVAIVPSCVYHGAPPRLRMPFKCSQHFVADTHKLQARKPGRGAVMIPPPHASARWRCATRALMTFTTHDAPPHTCR